jgi:hypothetical protein
MDNEHMIYGQRNPQCSIRMRAMLRYGIALVFLIVFPIASNCQAASNGQAAPATTPTACAGCFATIGIGANLNSKGLTDYNNASNILEATHLGNATPQLLVGISYQVPWHGFFYSKIKIFSKDYPPNHPVECDPDLYNQDVDGVLIYCYPWRPFISAKFTTDASQTFNGFTFGMSHRLARYVDVLVGYSFTAFNEASPGFQRAAIQAVETQQAAGNKYYSQFSLTAMQQNWHDAFDGFPTQLISSTGTAGALIYAGNPLSVHYHSGAFVGVVVPITLKSLLGAK